MKAILHVHTSYSRDGLMSPATVVARACQEGASFLLVSDHDSFEGARAVRSEIGQRRARLYAPIAAEILTDLGDVIVAFDKDGPDLTVAEFKEFGRLVAKTHSLGGMVLLPHPYRGHLDPQSMAPKVDLVEVFNARCTDYQNSQAQTLAIAAGKAPAHACDAHLKAELGLVSSQYDGPAVLATLLMTPRALRTENTFRWRMAFSSLTKAVRDRRSNAGLYSAVSLARNVIQETVMGRSRLHQ